MAVLLDHFVSATLREKRQAMIDDEETALRKRVLYCILYYVLLSYILLFYDMILRKSTTRRAPCESRTICIILF